jgi:hypothetical protein
MSESDRSTQSVPATSTRRGFLRATALGLATGSVLAACAKGEAAPHESSAAAAPPAPPPAPTKSAREKAEELDSRHA